MLRAGQMFVAECLLRQRLGRNYVWSESAIEDERYTEILELFRDTHSAELSLQQVSIIEEKVELLSLGRKAKSKNGEIKFFGFKFFI